MSDLAPAEAPQSAPVSPELASLRDARKKLAERRAAIAATAAAAQADPATVLALEKVALARELREAAVAEHNIAADAIYLEACVQRGDNKVALVRTSEGNIVLRAQTEIEVDLAEARAAAHRARPAASEAEKVQQAGAAKLAVREGLKGSVLTDLAHFDRVTKENKLLWTTLFVARNALISAEAHDTGKDVAP